MRALRYTAVVSLALIALLFVSQAMASDRNAGTAGKSFDRGLSHSGIGSITEGDDDSKAASAVPSGPVKELPARVEQHALRVSRASIDLSHLLAPSGSGDVFAAEGNVVFEVFPGESHRYIGERTDGIGASTWVGRLDDPENDGSLVISKVGEVFYGIAEVGRARYIIESNPKHGAFVWEVDHSKDYPCGVTREPHEPGAKDPIAESPKPRRAFTQPGKYGGSHDVDIFIYYTGNVYANYVDPAAIANTLVASANLGLSSSGVTGSINIVGYSYINTM